MMALPEHGMQTGKTFLRKESQNGVKRRALLESLRLGTKGDACAGDANFVPVCSDHPKLCVLVMLRLNP
jgi:hypothetical protein